MKQYVVCSVHVVKNNAILDTVSHWWSLIYSTVPLNMKVRWIIGTLKTSEFKSIYSKHATRQNFLIYPISYFIRVTSPGLSPQNKIIASSSNRYCSSKVDNELLYEGESITIRTVCFIFRKTRAEILQLHNFSTYSPCFTMYFVHHCTICFMTLEEKVLGWETSHACTVTSSCWSMVNQQPLKAC
jgi:hypothetical protein